MAEVGWAKRLMLQLDYGSEDEYSVSFIHNIEPMFVDGMRNISLSKMDWEALGHPKRILVTVEAT